MANKKKGSLTLHSTERVEERLNLPPEKILPIFQKAIYNGYHGSTCPNKEIKRYICDVSTRYKRKSVRVKVLHDIVFIYNKNSKYLITCYMLPDEFMGILDYSQEQLDKHKLVRV